MSLRLEISWTCRFWVLIRHVWCWPAKMNCVSAQTWGLQENRVLTQAHPHWARKMLQACFTKEIKLIKRKAPGALWRRGYKGEPFWIISSSVTLDEKHCSFPGGLYSKEEFMTLLKRKASCTDRVVRIKIKHNILQFMKVHWCTIAWFHSESCTQLQGTCSFV